MREPYLKWSELPYAGEKSPPRNSEEKGAGKWPLILLKRIGKHEFADRQGRRVHFHVTKPEKVDWEKQLKIVEKTLATLTKRQRAIALYWSEGAATKQWTPIIDRLIDAYGVSAPRAARILAAVQAAIADSFTITWYYKFLLDVARPNQLNQNLTTVACTPRHPSYPSGHAAVAGAAATVLSYFFPAESNRLEELALEAADSRLYAGVHFPIDNEEGLKIGRKVGEVAVDTFSRQTDIDHYPVDLPFRTPAQVELLPPPYEQAIPFRFKDTCTSLREGSSSPSTQQAKATNLPHPKIYKPAHKDK